jgi:hypothetical protein
VLVDSAGGLALPDAADFGAFLYNVSRGIDG